MCDGCQSYRGQGWEVFWDYAKGRIQEDWDQPVQGCFFFVEHILEDNYGDDAIDEFYEFFRTYALPCAPFKYWDQIDKRMRDLLGLDDIASENKALRSAITDLQARLDAETRKSASLHNEEKYLRKELKQARIELMAAQRDLEEERNSTKEWNSYAIPGKQGQTFDEFLSDEYPRSQNTHLAHEELAKLRRHRDHLLDRSIAAAEENAALKAERDAALAELKTLRDLMAAGIGTQAEPNGPDDQSNRIIKEHFGIDD